MILHWTSIHPYHLNNSIFAGFMSRASRNFDSDSDNSGAAGTLINDSITLDTSYLIITSLSRLYSEYATTNEESGCSWNQVCSLSLIWWISSSTKTSPASPSSPVPGARSGPDVCSTLLPAASCLQSSWWTIESDKAVAQTEDAELKLIICLDDWHSFKSQNF